MLIIFSFTTESTLYLQKPNCHFVCQYFTFILFEIIAFFMQLYVFICFELCITIAHWFVARAFVWNLFLTFELICGRHYGNNSEFNFQVLLVCSPIISFITWYCMILWPKFSYHCSWGIYLCILVSTATSYFMLLFLNIFCFSLARKLFKNWRG